MSISSLVPDQVDAHQLLVRASWGRSTSTYEASQRIFCQGDAAELVYFVQRGSVEFSIAEDLREFVIGTAIEGQFFGAACLDGAAVRITTATAVSDCRITSVRKEVILAAISERPRFMKMFTDHLWYNDPVSNREALDRLARGAASSSEVALDLPERAP